MKTVPLMFVGMLMILISVESRDEFRTVENNCSIPNNTRMYDAVCRNPLQITGGPEKVNSLQHKNTDQLSGDKCEVRSHRELYYCWNTLVKKTPASIHAIIHIMAACGGLIIVGQGGFWTLKTVVRIIKTWLQGNRTLKTFN